MVSRIAILPTIFILGIGGFLLHANEWVVVGISSAIGVAAIVTDIVLARRKRARAGAIARHAGRS